MKRILLASILSTIALSAFSGGPWLNKQGGGFAQAQVVVPAYAYSRLLTGFGTNNYVNINRKTYNADLSLYGEYGITDKVDIIATLPYKFVNTGAPTDSADFSSILDSGSLSGGSNINLAIKYGLIDARWKLAVSGQARFNTTKLEKHLGLATGFQANSYGAILHGGGRVGKTGYGFMDLGFHVYDNEFSETVEGQVEYGRKIKDLFYVGANLGYRLSMYNGTASHPTLEQTGLYPNNQEWVAVSFKASYETKKGMGVNIAMPIDPIYFNNVGFNGTFSLGVYYKW